LAEMERADVLLVLLDGSMALTAEDEDLLRRTENLSAQRILVENKCDLPRAIDRTDTLRVSAKTEEGLDTLKRAILELAAPHESDSTCITNERHLHALESAAISLEHAVLAGDELECAATDIRAALQSLGSITGTDVDATVIDRIFERFCVGK